jgi:hypothetical protein
MIRRCHNRSAAAVSSSDMDLLGAILSGFVSGLVGGAIGATVVLNRRSIRGRTTGDQSPMAQSDAGPSVATSGNIENSPIAGRDAAGRDIITNHHGPKPQARLVAFTYNSGSTTRLAIRNDGDLVAVDAAYTVEGERPSFHLLPSQTPNLPARVAPGFEREVGMVIYSLGDGDGEVMLRLTWFDEDGVPGLFELPL